MYELAKASVQADIYTNPDSLITGNILQNTLLSMITSLGENSGFLGLATPGSGATIDAGDQKVWYICINNTANVISYPRYIGGTTTNLSPGGVAILHHLTSTSGWSWTNLSGNDSTTYSILGKIASILTTIGDSATAGSIIYRISVLENDANARIARAMDRGVHMVFQGAVGDTVVICESTLADTIVLDNKLLSDVSFTLTDTNEHHVFVLPAGKYYTGETIPEGIFANTTHCKKIEYSEFVHTVEDTQIVYASQYSHCMMAFLGLTAPKIDDAQALGSAGFYLRCHDVVLSSYQLQSSAFAALSYTS